MAADQLALDAQGTAHATNFVLEQGTQRLHNLQVHLLGQATHIVVRLDLAARPVDTHALDDIRINIELNINTGLNQEVDNDKTEYFLEGRL